MSDLRWIRENFSSFWPAAQAQFAAQRRGVIVVDTTVQPHTYAGHPMHYLPQQMAEEAGDDETKRMIGEYDPTKEFVVVLLKPEEKTSTYRVQTVQRVERGRPRRGR